MIEYTIYQKSTGKIKVVIGAPKKRIDKKLEKYPPEEYGYLMGRPPEPSGWMVSDGEFVKIPGFDEDRAWRDLRFRRDILLRESDYAMLDDTPTNKAAWRTYRKELRDLTDNVVDPFEPVFPDKPE